MGGSALRTACAFVPNTGGLAIGARSGAACLSRTRRRPRRCAAGVRMAKFQKRGEEATSPLGEDKSPLRPPPGALPTLSSLSGRDGVDVGKAPGADEKAAKEIASQGPGLSSEQEATAITFLREVAYEFSVIDWPSLGRVFKITLIVIMTMIIASAGIYTVDGFFLWLSQKVFDIPMR